MNLESEAACDSKQEKWRSSDVKTAENVDFSTLLLPDRIQLGLKNCGFEKPSPVQLQAIPLGRCGIDLVVQAKSGTGKTCVMAVIALDSLVTDLPNTQVLVLAPTREIASQICGVVRDLGYAFPHLTCDTFIGGLPLRSDKAKLPYCQIVVGTPGRIKQLIDMEAIQTESIRLFVVDEADKLFDKQFKEDINWIFSSLPSRKQILALSATYPEELSKFLSLYMETPVYVRISSEDPALLGITQCFRATPYHPMLQVTDSAKFDVLLDILNSITFSQCMIFCQRQTKVQDLADNLVLKGFPSLAICSALDQVRRLEIIQELKSFQCRVLVSTDLTARGIDAENVDLVINFEIPYEAETYLHRIGRAGRYGARGMSISLASSGDELKRLKSFQKKFLLKIYELPNPIPANLWDKLMTLQALEPEVNGHALPASNGFDHTNGLNGSTVHERSICENKPDHSLPVNHSNTVSDESGRSVPDVVSSNAVEANGEGVVNGCVPSNSLEKTEVIISETKQLLSSENKTEKTCEIEVGNPGNSGTASQVDYQKQSEAQNTSQENSCPAELEYTDDAEENSCPAELEYNGDAEKNPIVETFTQKSTDSDSMMHVPKEVGAVSSSSEMVTGIEGGNSSSSVKHDDSINTDISKDEDLNNGGIKPDVEKNLTDDHNELIKMTDISRGMERKELESKCEITSTQEEQAVQSKVTSFSLFQKWEKYFNGNEECIGFSDEDVSDILVPLVSIAKTEDLESNLSYSELLHCWESHNDHSASDPTKHYPETSVSDSTNIPQAQVEVLEKYIYHNKSKFFSSVQKIFEMECNLAACERTTGGEPPDDMSVSDENLNGLPASKSLSDDDDQLESKSVSFFQNDDQEQGSELLKNASISDSVITTTEDQNSCETNSSVMTNEDVPAECVYTCEEPGPILLSTAVAEPHAANDRTVNSRFLPFRGNKSVKKDPSTDKNGGSNSEANYLTEAVYDSVTCGIKHSRIVSLPPIPSDSVNESNSLNRKDGGFPNISDQKTVVKNQGVKKKVRGISQKTKKRKQKYHENALNSVQVSAFEPSVSNMNDVVEETDLLSQAYQGVETEQPRNNVTFDSASVPNSIPEQRQRVDRKKKGKRISTKHSSSNNYGNETNNYRNETNAGNGYYNPTSFTNSGTNDYCSPCVAFAPHYICCCRLPHVQYSDSYFQSPAPFHSVSPHYYYQKFLEQWYYIQELIYSYHCH